MSQPPDTTERTAPAETGVRFDEHGVLPIPDQERDCSPWELFWIWCGANIAPINWVLGALGITLGLSLLETLIVVVIGNLFGCAIFGLFNVIGHRTAVNQMVLGRSAFGIKGAALPALVQGLLTMAWVGVNTWVVLDLVLAVLDQLGISGGLGLRIVVAAVIMVVQLGLALYGFYAIRTFEKYTVPLTIAVMVVMTVLALGRTQLNWSTAVTDTPGEKLTAITQLITAIGIGWGLTWIPYAADYSRFVRPNLSARKVFWASATGMYIPTVWLAALGACLASAGGSADPSTVVVGTFGVLAIPVLLLIMHGPIATNILNLYSCSLAALTIGIRVARWKVTLFAGVIASLVLAVFINATSFAHAFDNWMVSILMWISPWMSILLVDYFLIHRRALSIPDLYREPASSAFGRVNIPGLVSLAAGLLAGWSWQYGLVPAMQGPVARALGNTDFSWLSGSFVAGGLYVLLMRARSARTGQAVEV
ncbi:purine-cytosine permease family protein [Nocardia sp. NPDC056000]|uniref:purine-cytosine permease family protein n=1 Tax=Nocardia sp. NPDC056000 TaxID=3345674 RepID=UPI0035E0779B